MVHFAVKPVCKGHSREPENVVFYEQLPFIYTLKFHAPFVNGKNETALYRQLFAE